MWKVMICDDEPEMCAQIRQSLARFTQECGAQFSIRECHSGEALLCRLEADTDLVFLDIRMEGLSGMEAARRLRKENRDVCLIFITTMTQYALEGYQVHAYGFLKKPLLYAQFRLLMLDALRSLAGKKEETITLKIGSEVHTVSLPRLLYLEVRNHEVRVVCTDGVLSCYEAMSNMEQLLRGHGFFRCHKSFCVNLRHITRITSAGVQMRNGDELPVSKHRRREFLEAFSAYAGGGPL